jgi:hypothetical protein
MVKMYVRHTVADFAKWKPLYEGNEATRKKFGAKKTDAFANINNPNEIIVVSEWDKKEQATKFAESSDLKERLKQAGIKGAPNITYSE